MSKDTILGFDFGMKRIGVAFANTEMGCARTLATIKARDGIPNWADIDALIKEWQPNLLVIGLPINIDGSTQHTTFAAKKFGNRLRERFQLPLEHVDERLTTIEARQQLFNEGGYKKLRQSEVDSYAAKLIIEQWMTDHLT